MVWRRCTEQALPRALEDGQNGGRSGRRGNLPFVLEAEVLLALTQKVKTKGRTDGQARPHLIQSDSSDTLESGKAAIWGRREEWRRAFSASWVPDSWR